MPELSASTYVKIAPDNMSAYLFLGAPAPGEVYSSEQVIEYLKRNGIISGVIYSNIEAMTKKGVYLREVKVAEGTAVVNGTNGYYEFKFNVEDIARRPVIRSDGSVDYQSMSLIQNITVGDVLAVYHPPVQGEQGTDIRGRITKPKVAKDLPVLRGKGFERSEDGLLYTATLEGKVEYKEYYLEVRDVYEVRGDVDLITGKIDFRGDVIISGNVESGVEIRATKSITINGHVEAAKLTVNGDIVIRKGMQGGQKAKITAGGDVYADFIEYTIVEAGGNVQANVIMNCSVKAGGYITVSGRRGYIVGGSAYAVAGITSAETGNDVGLKTVVAAGISESMKNREHMLSVKIAMAKTSIAKAQEEQALLEKEKRDIMNEGSILAKISQTKKKIAREYKMIERAREELDKIAETMDTARHATIRINQKAYAGTRVIVDDQVKELTSDVSYTEFYRNPEQIGISMRALVV